MASSSCKYLNCSKAQMCLFKILHVISSIQPSKEETCSSHGDDRSGSSPSSNKGVGIDLNLGFCSLENGESESCVIDQGNNNEEGEEPKAEAIRQKSVEVSEGRNTQTQSFKVENNEVGHMKTESEEDTDGKEGRGGGGKVKTGSVADNNCLDLLIEAAKVLSERDDSNSEENERGLSYELRTGRVSERNELLELEGGVKERKERWVVVDLYGGDVEEAQPMARSKRGRNRALPYRFRDSVLEPLKRSQRPSSTAHAKKRRLLRS